MRRLRFEIAFYVSGDIGIRDAGVVELVDAQDSKSCSERSVGSIPTARTILFCEQKMAQNWAFCSFLSGTKMHRTGIAPLPAK